MKAFTASEIEAMDRRQRANFINSISGFRTPYLIISGEKGNWNAGTFSNITHVGANPPQISVLFRPDNGKRHTLTNYREQGSITLCMMPFSAHETVHQSSVSAPSGTFEWEALGGQTKHLDNWPHPIPSQALWAVEVHFIESFTLSNNCIYTVGEIARVALLNQTTLDAHGFVDLKESVIAAHGLQSYHEISPEPHRLPFPNVKSLGLE